MSNRKISSIEINKKTIWIEVDQIDIIPAESGKKNHPSDLRKTAKPVGPAADYLKEKIASIGETLEAIVSEVDKGVDKFSPDEWSVEVNMGFAGEKRIPYIAKGEMNGSIKVTAKWKKTSPEETEKNKTQ